MCRAVRIREIVNARKEKSYLFENFLEWLTNVDTELRNCKNQFENPEISQQLDAADLSTFNSDIDNIVSEISEQKQVLEKVRNRLARNTITIAVAGEARIGKSTFLQSFTGLTNNQIPTQVVGACTSTQSIISHIDAESGYAIVHYYDKNAFMNSVIKNRYEKLGWDVSCLATISDFKRDFPNHERPVDAIEIAIYKDLKLYHDHIDEICTNIFDRSKRQERLENLNDVSKFVTYSKESGITQSRVSNLVVKKVEIFCKFPVDDVGQISVIDTPGMNTSTEDRDREILRDVLNNSADFVLLFGAPGSNVLTGVESRLYSEFRQCMPLLPGDELKKRAFFLANQGRFVDDNGAVYRDSTSDAFYQAHHGYFKDGTIPAERYIRLNAKEPTEVQEKVLDPLLDYLTQEFPRLDTLQLDAAKKILAGIGGKVKKLLEDINSKLGFMRSRDPENYKRFRTEFENLFPALTGCLSKTLDDMMPSRSKDVKKNNDDNVFITKLKQICRNYKQNTPDFLTIDAIQREIYSTPGGGGAAFFNLMSYLRCHIIGLFAGMDDDCQQIVEEAKTELENVFKASEAGRLAKIKELEDKHGSEFFAMLAKFAQTVKAPTLAEQLETYANFKLSFYGFMAHKVSANLDPVRTRGYREVVGEVDFNTPEAIQSDLRELGKRAIDAVAVKLHNSLSLEPYEAVFAKSENFVDITLRTRSIKDEWSNFYEALKGDVWPELFNPNSSANRSMLQMRENLSELKSLVDSLNNLVA